MLLTGWFVGQACWPLHVGVPGGSPRKRTNVGGNHRCVQEGQWERILNPSRRIYNRMKPKRYVDNTILLIVLFTGASRRQYFRKLMGAVLYRRYAVPN